MAAVAVLYSWDTTYSLTPGTWTIDFGSGFSRTGAAVGPVCSGKIDVCCRGRVVNFFYTESSKFSVSSFQVLCCQLPFTVSEQSVTRDTGRCKKKKKNRAFMSLHYFCSHSGACHGQILLTICFAIPRKDLLAYTDLAAAQGLVTGFNSANGMKFSTFDVDRDNNPVSCSSIYSSTLQR